jgi:hypothetical protein
MTFFCIDGDTLRRLFTTLVRPLLEYNHITGIPLYRTDELQIEKLQRRGIKFSRTNWSVCHTTEDYNRLNYLLSLDFRRRRRDTIQVFKTRNGLDRLDPERRCTREYKNVLLVPRSGLEVGENVFSRRILRDWNSHSGRQWDVWHQKNGIPERLILYSEFWYPDYDIPMTPQKIVHIKPRRSRQNQSGSWLENWDRSLGLISGSVTFVGMNL